MGGHTKGLKKNQFCSVRAETCECKNKYRAPCEAAAAGWDADPRAASRGLLHAASKYAQKFKSGAQLRGHEAHHIACVAAVSEIITANVDIDPVVKQTVWCINAADNMIALPMWAHTISWYVNLFDATFVEVGPPPFAGLAQHDYDHGAYIDEVNEDLESVANSVAEAVEAHEDPSGTLLAGLKSVIGKYRGGLIGRNTHGAWKDGEKNPGGAWYKAFSMSRSPTPRAFPGGSNDMAKKIAEVRDAFLKLFN